MVANNPIVRLETFANNYDSARAMALDLLLANFKHHKQVHEAFCFIRDNPEPQSVDGRISTGNRVGPTVDQVRDGSAPAMPCLRPDQFSNSDQEHREFNPLCAPSWPVMVARKVSKSEQASVPSV